MKLKEGERVYLRLPEPKDVDLFTRSLHHPLIRRLTGQTRVFSRDRVEQWLKQVVDAEDRIFCLIVDQSNDEVVGDVEINQIHFTHRNGNIRIALHEERHFGKGFGTEAMRLMIEYGFGVLNLHRLSLDVYAYNERAINTYKKLGFQQEGVQKEALYYDHQYHDVILMALLRKDYYARSQELAKKK